MSSSFASVEDKLNSQRSLTLRSNPMFRDQILIGLQRYLAKKQTNPEQLYPDLKVNPTDLNKRFLNSPNYIKGNGL